MVVLGGLVTRELEGDPLDLVCSFCGKREETPDFDPEEALEYAEKIGWQVSLNRVICPKCQHG
jgi:hypothetical protein